MRTYKYSKLSSKAQKHACIEYREGVPEGHSIRDLSLEEVHELLLTCDDGLEYSAQGLVLVDESEGT